MILNKIKEYFVRHDLLEKTTNNIIPQVIILSTQRSGTHLLLSFLENNSLMHRRGEIFWYYRQGRNIGFNKINKINIGILMYNQIYIFEKLGGILSDVKIIHLLRDPKQVAKSQVQMIKDKELLGDKFKGHLYKGESMPERAIISPDDIVILENEIRQSQKKYIQLLKNIPHLELHYEDIVPDQKTVEQLDQKIKKKILKFLHLKDDHLVYKTDLIKTAVDKNKM